jgi:hypothetical protein
VNLTLEDAVKEMMEKLAKRVPAICNFCKIIRIYRYFYKKI